jgi:preprotein translocase subunit YajC
MKVFGFILFVFVVFMIIVLVNNIPKKLEKNKEQQLDKIELVIEGKNVLSISGLKEDIPQSEIDKAIEVYNVWSNNQISIFFSDYYKGVKEKYKNRPFVCEVVRIIRDKIMDEREKEQREEIMEIIP